MNQSSDSPAPSADKAIRSYTNFGYVTLLILVGGIGGWAALASLQGAVIAPAQVIVKANSKMIQHLEGGIVSEILVTEGQYVEKGTTLLKLDTTQDASSLTALDANLNELLARHARLIAERDGLNTIQFPDELLEKAKSETAISQILKGQQSLSTARREAIEGQISQLTQRTQQLKEVIKGLKSQIKSNERQLSLIKKELKDLTTLKSKGLVPQTRLLALEREKAKLEGELGQLVATTARTKVQMGETKIQILQIQKEHLSTILTELRETKTKVDQLKGQRTALADKLRRMEITAPKSGIVHKLQVHTIGGVVAPGDPVLTIVPQKTDLIFAAKVNPEDIDQIFKGQTASVRLSAFDQRTTPEVTGIVSMVSADAADDGPNTLPYYKVFVELPKDQIKRLNGKELIPGMNVEIFIQTKKRPVYEYLLQPLTDQLRRTMREP